MFIFPLIFLFSDDIKFISKLDEDSKKKAKRELNELNDADRILAVQSFRQWVLQQKWLKTPTGKIITTLYT